MIRVVVCGACGRMGRRLVSLISESDDMEISGATERPGHEAIGRDVGVAIGIGELGVKLSPDLTEAAEGGDVIVDFTSPEATLAASEVAGKLGKAMVVGTTGLSADQMAHFRDNVRGISCVYAPNFSVGVNLLFRLVAEAAKVLGEGYDIEIIESHHRFKKDAPSGTAMRLAEIAAEALGRDLERVGVYGRKGMTGERNPLEIGIHSVRGGDIVGEHTVVFAAPGERVELVHRASSRDTFAAGALRAVRFVADAPPGLYDMGDVLGLKR